MNEDATHHEIALLAPVPEEHLVSGLVTCCQKGKANDNAGHWAVFWEVSDLREFAKDEAIPMNHFSGCRTEKKYAASFIPTGPLLVDAL